MDLWSDLIHGSSDLDRTLLYQQQAQRDKSVEFDGGNGHPADGDILKKLGLTISIRAAQKSDLKRIAELINRTNQWNLCGSRTSFEEVLAWHESTASRLLIAAAADRFGDMGTVCVAVVTEDSRQAEIPLFVLSCRVFGYGVESAMLNEISRRCGIGAQRSTLIGHFRATAQNHPGRNMYADHGFRRIDESFVWTGESVLPGAPWAEIRVA
jgi:FkbH-like protein